MSYRNAFSLLLLTSLTLFSSAVSDSPAPNTIPVIAMKTGQGETSLDLTLEAVLRLLWHNFDGVWLEGWASGCQSAALTLADSVLAVVVLAPSELQALNNDPVNRWARYSPAGIHAASAFIHSEDFSMIDDERGSPAMITDIAERCSLLAVRVSGHDCIWYYDIFNEGPSWQLNRMLSDSLEYDDYFPSVFTQDTLLTEVDPTGVFSWAKWKSDSLYSEGGPTVSICFGTLHTIDSLEWADYSGIFLGTFHTQANSVRSYFNTRYMPYGPEPPYILLDNFPERLDLNTYPVRLAGYYWQTVTADSITVLGSETDQWLLEHYENLMDSTFIPAATDPDGPFPIQYHPQAFGRTGGASIWSISGGDPPDTVIQYGSYNYRIPSPAEFRMLCNLGLLRGARGVFPYSIRSYCGWDGNTLTHHDAGLLDEDLIPFDAPYEDWVYRERPSGDYFYAPPDSIPPWTAADGGQFDPLYSLPSRPSTTGAKALEDYLEWKFSAYGRLWNSTRETLGGIARIAPELSGLWWWFDGGRYDDADIAIDGYTIPQHFAQPHIRVFTDSTGTDCYLFYVNRFCRANGNPFEITVDAGDFPSGTPFSEYALDHSRRFIIEGGMTAREVYAFRDTLDAGEARLLQMFDYEEGLDADVRITDPDVNAILPVRNDTLLDCRSVPGETVDVLARFYNMGTEPKNNVRVFLVDETSGDTLDVDVISFGGLSTSSCYTPDMEEVSFTWIPDSTDIGVHVLRVSAETWVGEPDPSDNTATLVYLVDPRDYATEVLGNPWDMTETTGPAWFTDDVDSLTGCWTAYTDSITGMFEGVLSYPTQANRLYLNTGTGSSQYIDADMFHNLSLAGRSSVSADIEVHWIDDHDQQYQVDTGMNLTATARDVGPVDLSALSNDWTGMVKKFWLEFTAGSGNLSSDVRIGWIRLTE